MYDIFFFILKVGRADKVAEIIISKIKQNAIKPLCVLTITPVPMFDHRIFVYLI